MGFLPLLTSPLLDMRTVPSKPNSALHTLIEQICRSGQMSRQEHLYLASMLLATGKLNDSERQRVNRLFDAVQSGRLRVVD